MADISDNDCYDLLIVGGGPAGLMLATLAGQGGIRTALVEAGPPPRRPEDTGATHDARTTALSYGSKNLIECTGLWAQIADAACPITDIDIMDGRGPVLLQFLNREADGKTFGWIVENDFLRATLRQAVEALESVTIFDSSPVDSFIPPLDASAPVSVSIRGGRTLHGQILAACDGRNSFIRRQLNISTIGRDYRQTALVAPVWHENHHENKAVEHFRSEGPFAILPMNDAIDPERGETRHRSALVWTDHGGRADAWKQASLPTVTAALQARFPDRYGAVAPAGAFGAYPLSLRAAQSTIGPRTALLAEAAHAIHPIAGQGLNMSLRDVAELSELILAARDRGADPGHPELLQRYQARRRTDNLAMAAVTDGFNRLFGTDRPAVKSLRTLGLAGVKNLRPARRFFMTQAMGLRGIGPRSGVPETVAGHAPAPPPRKDRVSE